MEEDSRLVAVYVANLDVNLDVKREYSLQFGPGEEGDAETKWTMGEIKEKLLEVIPEIDGKFIYWSVDQARFPTMTAIVKLGGDNWGFAKGREAYPWRRLNMTMDEVLGILREDLEGRDGRYPVG